MFNFLIRSRLALGSFVSFLCVLYQSLYRAVPSNADLMTALPIAREFAQRGLYSPYDLIVSSGMREPYHLYKYLGGFLYQLHANVDLVWEMFFLAFLFFTFLAIWYLSVELTSNNLSSAFVLAIIAVAHPLRGSLHASAVPQAAFVVAMAAMPFALWAIILFLRKRFLAAMALSGLVFNLHPYIGLLTGSAIGVALLCVSEESVGKRFRVVIAGSLFALPNIIYILTHLPSNFSSVGYDFYAQFRLYAMHAFIEDHWREGYGWFFMNIAGAIWFSRYIDEWKRRAVWMLFACWFMLMGAYAFNSYVTKNTSILLMFLFRATYFIKPIVFIFVVHGIRRWREELKAIPSSGSWWKPWELSAAILILFVSAILPMKFAVAADVLAMIAYASILDLMNRGTRYMRLLQGGMFGICVLSLVVVFGLGLSRIGVESEIAENVIVGIVVACSLILIGVFRKDPRTIPSLSGESSADVSASRLIAATIGILMFHHLIISLKDWNIPLFPDIAGMKERIMMHKAPERSAALMRWARTDTPERSLFVVPPDDFADFGAFRLVTGRSLFVTIVEVNQLSLDASVYRQAHERVLELGVTFPERRKYDVNGYYDLSLQTLRKLARGGHADYIVFDKNRLHSPVALLPTVYHDENFVVINPHDIPGE